MGALTRWDPFKELEDMQNRLSVMFGRAPVRKNDEREESLRLVEWAPLVDIVEDEKEYLIKAELPQVKKDEMKIGVQNDVLTITGERTHEKEDQGKKYHRVERAYGSFARSFTLPEDADAGKVTAEFQHGVLTVHLPKSEKAKPKHIEIKVA